MGTFIDPRFASLIPLGSPIKKLAKIPFFHQDFQHSFDADWWKLAAGGSKEVSAGELRLTGRDYPAADTETDLWQDNVWVLYPVELEIRVRHDVKDANCNFMWALIDLKWNNDILIRLDYPMGGNINIEARRGGSATDVDTGIAADTSPHTYLFRWFSERVEFYRDGSLIGTITTNVPNTKIRPYLQVWIKAGSPAKTLYVDYIILRKL